MMRKVAKPQIAIAVTVSLLMLSLSFLNLPQTQASGQTSRKTDLTHLARQPQVFEQKSADGEVLARLRVSPAESPDSLNFQVEDLQSAGKAVGTVRITSDAVRVRFTDEASKTRLGMDIRPDQETPGRTRITLLYNKHRCEIAIDGARARSVATKMQGFANQGNRAEVKRLIPELGETFSGEKEYLAFTKRVASSPAFAILSAAASLKASLSSDEAQKHPSLQIVGLAVSLLAPGALKKSVQHQTLGQSSRSQPPRLTKVGYSANALNRVGGLSFAQRPPCDCCYACEDFLVAAIFFGCIPFYWYCIDPIFGLGWDWWICDALTAACIASAYYAFLYCWNIQCGVRCGELC